jgi:hypothetical protein
MPRWLWGGGMVVSYVGMVNTARGHSAGLILVTAGAAGLLGGPILGGVGLYRSATALESLGAGVDRTLIWAFWGSYAAQFIPIPPVRGAAVIATPILLALERRNHQRIYHSLESD